MDKPRNKKQPWIGGERGNTKTWGALAGNMRVAPLILITILSIFWLIFPTQKH